MGKGNYTHVQELLPEIKAMLASGKTQREVAEYFGFRGKYVVKRLVKRERAKQRKQELRLGPRDGRETLLSPEISLQNRVAKSGVCEWRMNCCGIFCDPQKGSESKSKIHG